MTSNQQIMVNLIKGNIELLGVFALLVEDIYSRFEATEKYTKVDLNTSNAQDIFYNLKKSIHSLEQSVNYFDKIITTSHRLDQ